METLDLLKHLFFSDISLPFLGGIFMGIVYAIRNAGVEGLDG